MEILLYLIKHYIIVGIKNYGIIFHLYWIILHAKTLILNQINGNMPRSGVIDQETINPHDLCYQCPKDGPDFYLVSLGIFVLKTNHIPLQK